MESNADPAGFTAAAISRVKTDTAFRAVMSRADNPAFESAAWEHLIPYCRIEKDHQRIPFAVVGAAIAKIRPEANGTDDIGSAFRKICKNQDDIDRESRRFRRLIGCDSVSEICRLLRPLLPYLASKGAALDYTRLLFDLLFWEQDIKLRWTVHFYRKSAQEEPEAEA